MSIMNPYKGLFPYGAEDEQLFFGRAKESADLTGMIKDNKFVVLFGESGTGKTSLIHAKLFPLLRNQYYFPIYIRINFSGITTPIIQTREIIYKDLSSWDNTVSEFKAGQTLLEYASITSVFKGLVKPILFFDQFEELFTIAPKYNSTDDIEEFIKQLSELIEMDKLASPIIKNVQVYDESSSKDDIKQKDKMAGGNEADDKKQKELNDQKKAEAEKQKELEQNENILKFKIVFSLRQDFIAQLDDLRFRIPSIVSSRYRIKKFNYVQAYEAIVGPPREVAKNFPDKNSPIISNEAAFQIIKELGKPTLTTSEDIQLMQQAIGSIETGVLFKENRELESLEFDPTVLSLYCYQLFADSKIADSDSPQITIGQVHNSPFDQIIRKYYNSSLPKTKLKYAIEDFLITPDGRRVLMPLKDFITKAKTDSSEIEKLKNKTAILRIYGNSNDDDREIEIAHDQVAKQALISKKEREANKIKRRAIQILVGGIMIVSLGILFTLSYVEKQKSNYTVIDLRQTNQAKTEKIAELDSEIKSLETNNSQLKEISKHTHDSLSGFIRKLGEVNNARQLQLLQTRQQISNIEKQNADLNKRYYSLFDKTRYLQNENYKLNEDIFNYKRRFDIINDSFMVYKKLNSQLQQQINVMNKLPVQKSSKQ